MAYNSNVWFPSTQYPYTSPIQQPSNGLVRIDSVEDGKAYVLPPSSVSPPLFLSEENAFLVKTTDEFGTYSLKKYSFEETPLSEEHESEYVTREYFDQQMSQILEAINGKEHPVRESTGKSK